MGKNWGLLRKLTGVKHKNKHVDKLVKDFAEQFNEYCSLVAENLASVASCYALSHGVYWNYYFKFILFKMDTIT